jgi:FkbM family methyltransferase
MLKKISLIFIRAFRCFGIVVISWENFRKMESKANPTSVELCHRFNIEITSVLHIGSHSGDEASHYWHHGIRKATFIEASSSTYERLLNTLREFPGFTGLNSCISDKVGLSQFFISDNDGASSSILKPRRHSSERPDIVFSEGVSISTTTLDILNLGKFDLIVIDVQGAEGLVIKGGLSTVESAKALYLECNIGDMYEGDVSLVDLISLLGDKFHLVYVDMTKNLWGDCLFIHKSLIKS